MRAYSMDLRERVLCDSDAGLTAAAVAVQYHVSASWVRRLKQRRRETGEVAPRQQRYGRHPVLAPQLHTLAALIQEQPDRTLADLQVALGTSASLATIWRAVKQLGFTLKKKTVRASEHDRPDIAAARAHWPPTRSTACAPPLKRPARRCASCRPTAPTLQPHRAVLRQTQNHRPHGPLSIDRHALATPRRVSVALHPDRVSQLRPALRVRGRQSVMKNAVV